MRTYTHKKRIALNLDDMEETVKVGKALSSEIRLGILKYLVERSANISEIAKEFDIPQSSAALHIRVLEDAGMIRTHEQPGLRGSQKVCGIVFEDIYLNAFSHRADTHATTTVSVPMPIGNYFDCEVNGNCGLISEKSFLGLEDSPASFYADNRSEAQLLWFDSGYVEYRFPNYMMRGKVVDEVSFSFEICSEAPGYQNDWPSDITIWLNNAEIASVLSPGDFGGRRGRLNPEWWGDSMTQYGMLTTIRISDKGCFINEEKCSDETIRSLSLGEGNCIRFKLGVKEDAVHPGGMNLFGDKFGDYAQNIVMKVKIQQEDTKDCKEDEQDA